MSSNFQKALNSATIDDDPSTRSESSSSSSASSQSESIHLTGIKLLPTADNLSDSNSSYKSATSIPSIQSRNNSFHSALLPPHSPEKTISELDVKSIASNLSENETDVNFEPSASSDLAAGEPNKYLDYDDYFATKKLLGKLCKTMVESSCHNGKKNQELNKNLDKLEKSFGDNVLVLNDFVNDFDIKTAEKVKEMVVKVDPQMSAMEEIAQFSAALNSLEEWLDLTGAENDREMATLERAKQNLDKQKEIEAQVYKLEELSFKRRKVFDALELDDPRMLREAMTSKKDILDPNNYGVKECKEFIPHFLADVKDFETDLSQMKRFFVSSGLHHPEYFNKMEHLIESVKSEVQEHVQPISTGSSMASLLTSESSEIAIIAYSTKNSCFAPSTSENEEDLEIEVSRSATTRSNSEASLSSLAASDSTQASSTVCDSVASTQASSSDLDTVDLTQTSSTCMITVESTQASVSEESMTQSSSVSTCATSDLECDKTQNSDANDEIAISSPKGSSLKTAMSLHDIISADSMDSSSTIAI